jgi:ATP-dependent RNA helicase SUPV3L1/SUV3
LIEVWRAGRLEGPRRHRRAPRAHTESRTRSENLDRTSAQSPAAAEITAAPAGEAVDGADLRQDRKPRRHRQGRSDQNRPDQNRPDRDRPDQRRPDQHRPDQHRPDRGDRPGRPERAGRGDRPDRDPDLRAKYVKGRGEVRDRREKAPDPNSPFAKLAALKEQLEANAKERR